VVALVVLKREKMGQIRPWPLAGVPSPLMALGSLLRAFASVARPVPLKPVTLQVT
jgi:hypothetical protein